MFISTSRNVDTIHMNKKLCTNKVEKKLYWIMKSNADQMQRATANKMALENGKIFFGLNIGVERTILKMNTTW